MNVKTDKTLKTVNIEPRVGNKFSVSITYEENNSITNEIVSYNSATSYTTSEKKDKEIYDACNQLFKLLDTKLNEE